VSYYARKSGTASDGTPTFATASDTANEDTARAKLEAAWGCELRRFGHLAPIDWFAVKHGRLTGLVELKTRTHAVGRFPTVFLNLRKWLALTLGQAGTGARALFAVQWTDSLRWVPVAQIDASAIAIGGTMQIVKAASDIEPVIHVPVETMRVVA
jgi:hypothetical protein